MVPIAALLRDGDQWAVFAAADGRTQLQRVQDGGRMAARAGSKTAWRRRSLMRGGRQRVEVVRGRARSAPRHKTRHTWRHRRKGKASDRKPLISRVAGLAYFVGIRCYARGDRCAATKQELNGLCAAACSPWLRNGRNGTRPFTARASKRNDVARTVS